MYENFYVTFGYPNNIKKIIKIRKVLNSSELTYEDFVHCALEGTSIPYEDFNGFENYNGACIHPEIFFEYVNQYISHPSFIIFVKVKDFINIDNLGKPQAVHRQNACIGPSLIITPEVISIQFSITNVYKNIFQSLKGHICQKRIGKGIIESFNKKKYLTDTERRKIISFVAEFLQVNFGFKPNKTEQILACEACINLFPSLKSDNENRIRLLFNHQNTGYLQVRLKNDRVRKRKLELGSDDEDDKENYSRDLEYSQNIEDDMEILKKALLPEELSLVKAKLKSTLQHRKNLIKEESYDLLETFKYFFICPDLIDYEFSLLYPTYKGRIVAEWPKYSDYVFNVIRSSGKNILFTEIEKENEWPSQILTFINLIRLLPPAPTGNKKAIRLSEEKAVERLIVFQNCGNSYEELLSNSAGKAPYLIAAGSSKSHIVQYFIVLDSNLIPLKTDNFLHALDITFQLHFIFDIKYDSNLRSMWAFIQNYVYKISCPITPLVEELFLKFNRQMPSTSTYVNI